MLYNETISQVLLYNECKHGPIDYLKGTIGPLHTVLRNLRIIYSISTIYVGLESDLADKVNRVIFHKKES